MERCILIVVFSLIFSQVWCQQIKIEGYVFESDNRGYLNQARVEVRMDDNHKEAPAVFTNEDGYFSIETSSDNFQLQVTKDLFFDRRIKMSEAATHEENTYFFKIELKRRPGYLFDITLAEKPEEGEVVADAIENAYIEVYNNTTEELEFSDSSFASPNFMYTLTKGNYYTIMIRKEGYLAKRIEAYVDVEGCILCLEGLSDVAPGVSDNLTEGHEMGTLLANVEMERADIGAKFEIENIYYALDAYKLTAENQQELQKVIQLMRDNPVLEVEIGSHTDSRASAEYNEDLSHRRAEEVVKYLISAGGLDPNRLTAQGFGESQLVNRCSDGVECTEYEHLQNRRTELTITGIRKLKFAEKSLAEIKEEERMEALIESLDDEKVIEIKEGEEIPEELKQSLEKQKKEN